MNNQLKVLYTLATKLIDTYTLINAFNSFVKARNFSKYIYVSSYNTSRNMFTISLFNGRGTVTVNLKNQSV